MAWLMGEEPEPELSEEEKMRRALEEVFNREQNKHNRRLNGRKPPKLLK